MVRRVITRLIDDIDQSDADRTVEFALDGVTYAIDLSDKNAGKLRKALDPYITSGQRLGQNRRQGRPVVQARTTNGRDQNKAIREWAGRNGFELADRGRIPRDVVAAFQKAA